MKPLPEPDFKSTWWTPTQVGIALEVAAQDEHQPTAVLLVALGVYLGLRKDEAVNLRWQDLELDRVDEETGRPAPVCHIRNDLEWRPKGKKARYIPIAPDLARMLREHRQPSGYVLVPQRELPKRGGTKRVYRYDPTKLWYRILDAVAERGVPRLRFHDLRHTAASILLNNGWSEAQVAGFLGHQGTRLVSKVYGHLLAYRPEIERVGFTKKPAREGASSKVVPFPRRSG